MFINKILTPVNSLLYILLLGFSFNANASLIISGSFDINYDVREDISNINGSFVAEFDDSVLTGIGVESFQDLSILTAFTINPSAIGVTTYDISNTGVDIGFINGIFSYIALGGIQYDADVSAVNSANDDFFFQIQSNNTLQGFSFLSSTTDTSNAYLSTEAEVRVSTASTSVPSVGTFFLLLGNLIFLMKKGHRQAQLM